MLNIDYPGAVYFYDGSERLDRSQIEYAIEKTKENYAQIGVRFPHLEFLPEGRFPQLRGIDMLVIFVDTKDSPYEGSQWLEKRDLVCVQEVMAHTDALIERMAPGFLQLAYAPVVHNGIIYPYFAK